MSNAAEMDAQEIINYIATAPKKTPVKLYVREKPGMKVQWGNAHVYGGRRGKTVFGDWDELKAILDANADSIDYYDVENDCRNSAVPMLDLKGINARIEPGAIIRDRVEIGDRAVIMMGAIINIGSVIGEGSMIDMGAVLGGRATVGKNCHIGAGTVLAGVVEPASATPVIIEDDVMIGANAVVLEGVHVGKGAVVAADMPKIYEDDAAREAAEKAVTDGAEPEVEDRHLELKNVATGDLDLATEDEKKEAEDATKENEDLFSAMKEALGDKVEKVAVSARLTDAPACITTEGPLSLEMEKVLQKGPEGAPDGMPKSQRVLELNAKHPVFAKLVAAQKVGDADKIKQYSGLLYDQALLVEGILPEDPVAFAAAVCELM